MDHEPVHEPPKKSKTWIWILAGCGCALLALIVLGIVGAIAAPALMGRFGLAQAEKVRIDITALSNAVDTFALENGARYPTSIEELVTPRADGRTYLKGRTSTPLDPWKRPYRYEPPSGGRDYRIYTYGRDGEPGGEGADADIDNFSELFNPR